MDTALPLVGAEVGAILLTDGSELKTKITWGVSDQLARALVYQDNQDLPSWCTANRTSVRLAGLDIKHESGTSIESLLCVPIKTATKTFGVMLIINQADGNEFTVDDQERLEMLLSFVAVALDNSQLLKDRLDRQKIEQEMAIARQVQETILPQNIDEMTGVDIGAVYFPARDVSGDFYDVVKVSEDVFYVIIGDVSNKGVPAALVMSAATAIIKTLIAQRPDTPVAELAARVNDILAENVIREREMFVTLFFCRFDLGAKTVSYCNAGHLPGLYWDSESHQVVELSLGGPIIGQFPGITFKEAERSIASSDRLFLFTDGLTEAVDSEGNLFGRERVEQVFSAEMGVDPKEFCIRVKQWVDTFTRGVADDILDDFTILQVKIL
jgi:sigma-B regulation protein RsbU (phosphoserine phosphatase)